jgi:3-oxoacyl-[acyl-carrier-protein] synthase II
MGKGRRVVITGLGVVTSLGSRVERVWEDLLAGRSGVSAIRRFDASGFSSRIAAEISDFRSQDPQSEPGFLDAERIEQYALSAAWSALNDAGLTDVCGSGRCGIVFGGGVGTQTHEELFSSSAAALDREGAYSEQAFLDNYLKVIAPRPAERRSPGNVAAKMVRRYGFRGPVMAVMTACAAGTQAIGDAYRWIQRGVVDRVLAGGSDCQLYPMGLASFCLLGALSKRNSEPERASRPFDAERDGFVIGEGAGMLVLESLESAAAREAPVYAEIVGFGASCDAYRVTDPHPEGRGAVLAMRRALSDANLSPARVQYVNAHGTSTRLNDKVETKALKQVFGKHGEILAVSSTKSMLGHLTVAAGAVEAAVTALSVKQAKVHPTINLEVADPDCDLDYVSTGARELEIDVALSNSFAMGGQCASLLFRRYES